MGIDNSYLQSGHTVLLALVLVCAFIDLPGFPLTSLPYDVREFLKVNCVPDTLMHGLYRMYGPAHKKRVFKKGGMRFRGNRRKSGAPWRFLRYVLFNCCTAIVFWPCLTSPASAETSVSCKRADTAAWVDVAQLERGQKLAPRDVIPRGWH